MNDKLLDYMNKGNSNSPVRFYANFTIL